MAYRYLTPTIAKIAYEQITAWLADTPKPATKKQNESILMADWKKHQLAPASSSSVIKTQYLGGKNLLRIIEDANIDIRLLRDAGLVKTIEPKDPQGLSKFTNETEPNYILYLEKLRVLAEIKKPAQPRAILDSPQKHTVNVSDNFNLHKTERLMDDKPVAIFSQPSEIEDLATPVKKHKNPHTGRKLSL